MKQKAFTIVEIVAVFLLLTTLALVAIPAFQNVSQQAKAASVRAALDEARAAIKTYRSNEKLEGRLESFPDLQALQDRNDQGNTCPSNHIFSDCNMPDNPFCSGATGGTHCSGNKDQVTTGADAPRNTTSAGSPNGAGWRYDATTGLFYPNTTVMGENMW